jgi:hypothetical protein
MKWTFRSSPSALKVKIVGSVDYCIGAPKPRISETEVKYSGQSVYIKAYVSRPQERHDDYRVETTICAGVGLFVRKTVTLDRPVRGSVLFDASVDPPVERWPDS